MGEQRHSVYVFLNGPTNISKGGPFAAWWVAYYLVMLTVWIPLTIQWPIIIIAAVASLLMPWIKFAKGKVDRLELTSYSIRFHNGDEPWLWESAFQDIVDGVEISEGRITIQLHNRNNSGNAGSIVLEKDLFTKEQWDSLIPALEAKLAEAARILTPREFQTA